MAETRLSEGDVQRKWHEISPLIDRMMERVGTKSEFPVVAGSSLSGDDKALAPYQISHTLRMCLTAGVDHLHAVKVLVLERRVLHVAAPSSLARGALENFSAAYWMLGPKARKERILRTLQWYAKDFKDGDKAAARLNLPRRIAHADRMKKLFAVAARHGIADGLVKAGYTSSEAVQYAEENAPNLPLGVVLPWQLCSGFAHGRPWAYLGGLNLERTPSEADPTVVGIHMTSDLSKALFPSLASLQLLERFLRLYESRSGNHLA